MRLFVYTGSVLLLVLVCGLAAAPDQDDELAAALRRVGFTGRVGSSIEARLGRPTDPELVTLGRLLFFDKIPSLHDDNGCAGCHSPTNGFGDTQSIAIGIQNNDRVGPNRHGPFCST
jgi:cytochrome c peroxidase